ncbi:hypothetical protein DFH08DRAFT_483253 [Mycena albidolilacea]|uniref:Uncharacterized protein n=1 Tax=Mycena albidolilacea TaxID=1033008 RepID=A0AAD6Z7F1_9AGAR|nr:hypothetical protein DFH08DRAFT_483253 [Mycena albidolilacea]
MYVGMADVEEKNISFAVHVHRDSAADTEDKYYDLLHRPPASERRAGRECKGEGREEGTVDAALVRFSIGARITVCLRQYPCVCVVASASGAVSLLRQCHVAHFLVYGQPILPLPSLARQERGFMTRDPGSVCQIARWTGAKITHLRRRPSSLFCVLAPSARPSRFDKGAKYAFSIAVVPSIPRVSRRGGGTTRRHRYCALSNGHLDPLASCTPLRVPAGSRTTCMLRE